MPCVVAVPSPDDLAEYEAMISRIGNISEWDVTRVKTMASLFDCGRTGHLATAFYNKPCKRFNADLSRWNVSGAKSLAGMFNGALAFNADLSQWQVSGATSLASMFSGALAFNSGLSRWSVGRVVDVSNFLCVKKNPARPCILLLRARTGALGEVGCGCLCPAVCDRLPI